MRSWVSGWQWLHAFAAAAVTDANHRRSFFDPLLRHLAVSMTARDVYLAGLRPRG